MYEVIPDCLTAISNKWNKKRMTNAFGLVRDLVFRIDRCTFEYTIGISKLLHGSTQNVLRAYKEVNMIKDIFIDIRQNADAECSDGVRNDQNCS